jgi:hypothetical protein
MSRVLLMRGLVLFGVAMITLGCLQPSQKKPKSDEATLTAALGANAAEEARILGDNFRVLFHVELEKRITKLAVRGGVDIKPYSGSMYPSTGGGTNQSRALDQYDRAFLTKAAAWERARPAHSTPIKSKANAWHGHCNGFAAASTRHREPRMPVTINGVSFSARDIKALLAEVYMSQRTVSLSGLQCDQPLARLQKDPFRRPDVTKMDKCEDTNPGNFHLALTNLLGGANPIPFIAELSPDLEIWNYPVYRYSCLNCTENGWREISVAQAESVVAGVYTGARKYRFNPAATKFYDVALQVHLSDQLEVEAIGLHKEKLVRYRYVLEANDAGEIIGGEWGAESRGTQPDFLWLALDPSPATGDEKYANPEVDPDKVFALWRESLRLEGITDIDEPLRYPEWSERWGNFLDFSLSLDGGRHGNVFLGKPIAGEIKLNNKRWDGATAALTIDGEGVGQLRLSADKAASFQVTVKPGMNIMTASFSKGAEREDFEFRILGIQ